MGHELIYNKPILQQLTGRQKPRHWSWLRLSIVWEFTSISSSVVYDEIDQQKGAYFSMLIHAMSFS